MKWLTILFSSFSLIACVSGNIQTVRDTAKHHDSFKVSENYQSIYKRVNTCMSDRWDAGGLFGSSYDFETNLYSELGEAEMYVQLKDLTGNHIYLSIDLKKIADDKTQVDIRNQLSTWNGARDGVRAFINKESDKCS